ncbi:MAG: DUF2141 domain-containing protein [Bacteroidota bacterium]
MKSIAIAVSGFLLTLYLNAQVVELDVSNIEYKKGGYLVIGIWDNPATYLEQEKSLKDMAIEVKASTMKILINDLQPGKYAIIAYHDINGNDELEQNWIGIPKEPIGFANDQKIGLGPPSFEKVATTIAQNSTTNLKIRLD